ncbi:hypothetical protein KKA47_00165, partial [bacterium]|nr:hypothetical protein [bacterium]
MIKKRIKNLRDFIGSVGKKDFQSFEEFKESAIIWWMGLLALCLVITVLATISLGRIPERIRVGQVAHKDIKGDRNYEIVDEEATEKFRQEAISGVL